jgi:WD40 repeat protein
MDRRATVKIPIYTTEFENGKEVTFYKVELTLEGTRWEIKKRFNEFHDLQEALKKNHGNLPTLPGKTLLPVKKPEEIDKRRDGLEKYLQALISKVDVYANDNFVKFLELDEHKPELAMNSLEQVARITHMLMGYRDLKFTHDRKFYFSVTSDPNTVSRLDSYITNLNMPWDKKEHKDQVLLAVGNLEAWGRVKRGGDKYQYDRLWLKTFKSQAICLDFNEMLNLVAVGCDNGTLNLFQFNKDDPLKYTEITGDKIHTARIMNVIIDERANCVYTISEDRNFTIFDLKANCITSETVISTKKLTEMVVDFRNKIAYVADRGGSINVVYIGSPPSAKQIVKTSSEGAIRGLEQDFMNKRIYCTCHDDGYLHAFRLVDPTDPEGRIEKISSTKGAPKPRVLRYWADRNEMYVGHQDGLISVFNFQINTTGPIYSGKIHDGNINTIQIVSGENLLITGSGDKTIKVLSLHPVLESTRKVE